MMHRIRDAMQAEGMKIWTDEGIEPGTPLWKDTIEQAIESAGCIVVILSPDSKQSIWVKRELDYGQAQQRHTFAVLVAGDERNAVPFSLIGSQYIDLRTNLDAGVQKLVSAVSRHLDVESATQQKLRLAKEDAQRRAAEADLQRADQQRILEDELARSRQRVAEENQRRQQEQVVIESPVTEPQPVLETIPPATSAKKPRRLIRRAVLVIGLLALAAGLIVVLPKALRVPTTLCRDLPSSTKSSSTLGGGQGQLAFVSRRDGGIQIYRTDADGKNLCRLTTEGDVNTNPEWSPDGSRLAFVNIPKGNFGDTGEVAIIDTDGHNFKILSNLRSDSSGFMSPRWSPDGTTLAFDLSVSYVTQLYTLDVASETTTRLAPFGETTDTGNPAWSPDGQQIAFVKYRKFSDLAESDPQDSGIYVMNVDGSENHAIALNAVGQPYWSPDGAKIAFNGGNGIYIANAAGTELDKVYDTANSIMFLAGWSPNGEQLLLRGSIADNQDIYLIDVDGRNLHPISLPSIDDYDPIWSPDGKYIAFSGGETASMGEQSIYLYDIEKQNTAKLTGEASNPIWRP
ncbi:MAG: PD40 domain-containing protein [Anaerolineae bacterium]|nr:PD40 domain-containing protein [Anaerolineae bacterium]